MGMGMGTGGTFFVALHHEKKMDGVVLSDMT